METLGREGCQIIEVSSHHEEGMSRCAKIVDIVMLNKYTFHGQNSMPTTHYMSEWCYEDEEKFLFSL